MNQDFLPNDYSVPSNNFTMKLEEGDNEIRIMTKPVLGMVAWKDDGDKRKPVHIRMDGTFDFVPSEKNPARHFWAMIVYSRKDNAFHLLEVTQKGIQSAVMALAKNPKWGSPLSYDINIIRSGEGFDTEYQVFPQPKEELEPEILEKFNLMKFNLENLFEGKPVLENRTVVPNKKEVSIEDVPF